MRKISIYNAFSYKYKKSTENSFKYKPSQLLLVVGEQKSQEPKSGNDQDQDNSPICPREYKFVFLMRLT